MTGYHVGNPILSERRCHTTFPLSHPYRQPRSERLAPPGLFFCARPTAAGDVQRRPTTFGDVGEFPRLCDHGGAQPQPMNKTTIIWLSVGIIAGYVLSNRIAQLPVLGALPKL